MAWAPVMLLALLEWPTTRHWDPILFSLPLHVRWWIAMPLFFFAEKVVDDRLARMSAHLRESGLVSGESEVRLSRLERQTSDASSSVLIEAGLLVIAIATSVREIQAASDLAHTWYAAVSMPLARFIFLRWVERWVFWTVLLLQIARLELGINAMHPDRAGGLSALALPSRALSLVFAAIGSVLSADMAEHLSPGETLDRHVPSIITYAVICGALAALPLVAFTPAMIRAKRQMLLTFGVFGHTYVRDFQQRWLPSAKDSPLGSSDIQSLADLGNSHQVVAGMRLVPFPRTFVFQIAAGALLPLLPLYVHTVSMATLAAQLVKVIF
ncbi:MAG TPA: hypothetical protein VM686_17725 [Polyangiaceae bacterium]|nr:hypothetical protein [Polyangiaceae bacterium]